MNAGRTTLFNPAPIKIPPPSTRTESGITIDVRAVSSINAIPSISLSPAFKVTDFNFRLLAKDQYPIVLVVVGSTMDTKSVLLNDPEPTETRPSGKVTPVKA